MQIPKKAIRNQRGHDEGKIGIFFILFHRAQLILRRLYGLNRIYFFFLCLLDFLDFSLQNLPSLKS